MTALAPYEFFLGKALFAAFSDFYELALILKDTLGYLCDGTRDGVPNLLDILQDTCVACDLVLAALPVGECGDQFFLFKDCEGLCGRSQTIRL